MFTIGPVNYGPPYYYYGGPQLIGPMVYIKTYIFHHFYRQYLVLLTRVPRNTSYLVHNCGGGA